MFAYLDVILKRKHQIATFSPISKHVLIAAEAFGKRFAIYGLKAVHVHNRIDPWSWLIWYYVAEGRSGQSANRSYLKAVF